MKVESYRDNYREDHSEDEDEDFHGDEDIHVDVGCNNNPKVNVRKSNKPVMEKRRRARINNCLNDLKGILLEAMRKDPARHSKLEKADILELTVRHLQNVQRNQLAIAMATDPTVLHRFKNGFSECATEVGRYLGRLENVEHGIKQRLTGHLGSCVNGLQQVGPVAFGSSARYSPGMSFPVHSHPQPIGLLSPPQSVTTTNGSQDFNNNLSTTNSSPSSTITSSDFDLSSNFTSTFTTSSTTPPPSPLPAFPLRSTPKPPVVLLDGISSGNLTEKGTNTIPLFNIGGGPPIKNKMGTPTGLPLDFSVTTLDHSKGEQGALKKQMTQRVGKVEPMKKIQFQIEPTCKGMRDSMWRPW